MTWNTLGKGYPFNNLDVINLLNMQLDLVMSLFFPSGLRACCSHNMEVHINLSAGLGLHLTTSGDMDELRSRRAFGQLARG